MKTRLLLLFAVCSATWASAQQLRFALQPVQYYTTDGQVYWDFYSTLDASTVSYKMNDDSTWSSSMKVALQLGGKLDVFQFNFSGKDSASGAPLMLQKSTFLAPEEANSAGTVPVNIVLIDEMSGQEWNFGDTLELISRVVDLADPLILDQVESAPETFMKGDASIVPLASLGVPVFEKAESLRFFTEGYVSQGKYIIQYDITASDNKKVPGTSGFKRCTQVNNPVLVDLTFKDQQSGSYSVNTRLLDSTGQVVQEASAPFMWFNQAIDSAKAFDPSFTISQANFERSWGDWSEVYEYLRMVAPVASLAERRILSNLKGTEDTATAAQFLVSFWQGKAPESPSLTWKGYLQVVNKVDREFGSKTLPGYRTQMGRVFLQYGAPSLVEERPFDGKNYPYQIWQYDQLKSGSTPVQQNQVFIFVDQELVGRQYTLIHSSALGEVKDHKWQYHLSRTTNAGPDIDATSSQYGRDNFGERISNSLIIGNQGTWFDRFYD